MSQDCAWLELSMMSGTQVVFAVAAGGLLVYGVGQRSKAKATGDDVARDEATISIGLGALLLLVVLLG